MPYLTIPFVEARLPFPSTMGARFPIRPPQTVGVLQNEPLSACAFVTKLDALATHVVFDSELVTQSPRPVAKTSAPFAPLDILKPISITESFSILINCKTMVLQLVVHTVQKI